MIETGAVTRNEDWLRTIGWDLPTEWDEFVRFVGGPSRLAEWVGRPALEAAPPVIVQGFKAHAKECGWDPSVLARLGENGGARAAATHANRFGRGRLAGAWDEALHPRDERGRFGEGTGLGTAGPGLPPAQQPPDPYPYDDPTFLALTKSDNPADQDEAARRFAANRQIEQRWESEVRDAIATGRISYDDAVTRWGEKYGSPLVDSLAKDLGGREWAPLPDELWHVTTNAPGVEQAGRLMTRDELEMDFGQGLGGGTSNTISFTTDPAIAERILDAFREAQAVAAGDHHLSALVADAESGLRADRPFLRDIASYYQSYSPGVPDWKPGDPFPRVMQTILDRDQQGELSADERLDFYKTFSTFRGAAGGPEDPLFFSTDAQALAAKDPNDFAIVKVAPVDGAMGVKVSALGEWRVPTGKAVTIEKIGMTAAAVR